MAIELIFQRTESHAHVGIFLFPELECALKIKTKLVSRRDYHKKIYILIRSRIFIKCTQNFYTLDKQSNYNTTYTGREIIIIVVSKKKV